MVLPMAGSVAMAYPPRIDPSHGGMVIAGPDGKEGGRKHSACPYSPGGLVQGEKRRRAHGSRFERVIVGGLVGRES